MTRYPRIVTVAYVLLALPVTLLLCLGSGMLVLRCDKSLDPADAIVVLGYPARATGEPSDTMEARVRRGVNLYFDGYAPNLILAGGSVQNRFVEAEVMASLANKMGVPSHVIILEKRSQNTTQNAQFVAEILHAQKLKSVIIVTSPYHTRRAVTLFEDKGIEVVGCAASDGSKWVVQVREIAHEYVNWIWYFCDRII